MLKRCLLAVIVTLLVTSSQIAAAEDYDWSKAPRIGTKAELARYIENERCRVDTKHPLGQTEIHFVLTNFKFSIDREIAEKERDNLLNEYCYSFAFAPSVGLSGVLGTGQLTYMIITEFPGTRIANAYLSSNQQQAWMNLSDEQKDLYSIAVSIVDESNKLSSEREKARYIHDEICRRVETFESGKNTAIDALIYKNASCQGYADSFYMLGRMAGLNVGRIGGQADGGAHAWNWITFADKKTYCVDVTLDDRYNTHEWFLANFEVMKRHHSCEWEIIPNLQ